MPDDRITYSLSYLFIYFLEPQTPFLLCSFQSQNSESLILPLRTHTVSRSTSGQSPSETNRMYQMKSLELMKENNVKMSRVSVHDHHTAVKHLMSIHFSSSSTPREQYHLLDLWILLLLCLLIYNGKSTIQPNWLILVRVIQSFLVPMMQMPVMITFFITLRRMAAEVPSLQHEGILWFTDLVASDPLMRLPIIACITMMASTEIVDKMGTTPLVCITISPS